MTNTLAKIALVRIQLVAPIVIGIVFVAAFQATSNYGDLWSLLLFSLIGWFMKRFSWPRPPVILGLVLSSIIENYLFISTTRYGWTWMSRPIVIGIAVLIAISLFFGFRSAARKKKPDYSDRDKPPFTLKFNPGVILTLVFFLIFGIGVAQAAQWDIQARMFPWVIGFPTVVLCFCQLFGDLFQRRVPGAEEDVRGGMDLPVDRSVPMTVVISRALNTLFWILGLFGAVFLFGFVVSVPVFVLLYLAVQAREPIKVSLISSLSVLFVIVLVFHLVLNIPWPEGVFPGAETLILNNAEDVWTVIWGG